MFKYKRRSIFEHLNEWQITVLKCSNGGPYLEAWQRTITLYLFTMDFIPLPPWVLRPVSLINWAVSLAPIEWVSLIELCLEIETIQEVRVLHLSWMNLAEDRAGYYLLSWRDIIVISTGGFWLKKCLSYPLNLIYGSSINIQNIYWKKWSDRENLPYIIKCTFTGKRFANCLSCFLP